MAKHMGLENIANNPDIAELSQLTSIEDVAQTIRESIPDTQET